MPLKMMNTMTRSDQKLVLFVFEQQKNNTATEGVGYISMIMNHRVLHEDNR